MRGRSDPVWKRYYDVAGRAHLAYQEGRISRRRLCAVIEAARKRSLALQEARGSHGSA